jgi:hypothetical protein
MTGCHARRIAYRWREWQTLNQRPARTAALPGSAQPHRDLLIALLEGRRALLSALLASDFRKALQRFRRALCRLHLPSRRIQQALGLGVGHAGDDAQLRQLGRQ